MKQILFPETPKQSKPKSKSKDRPLKSLVTLRTQRSFDDIIPISQEEMDELLMLKPKIRADCHDIRALLVKDLPDDDERKIHKPCPFVSCRYHMGHIYLPNGKIRVLEDFPIDCSCCLDVVEEKKFSPEDIKTYCKMVGIPEGVFDEIPEKVKSILEEFRDHIPADDQTPGQYGRDEWLYATEGGNSIVSEMLEDDSDRDVGAKMSETDTNNDSELEKQPDDEESKPSSNKPEDPIGDEDDDIFLEEEDDEYDECFVEDADE